MRILEETRTYALRAMGPYSRNPERVRKALSVYHNRIERRQRRLEEKPDGLRTQQEQGEISMLEAALTLVDEAIGRVEQDDVHTALMLLQSQLTALSCQTRKQQDEQKERSLLQKS